jgi:hypothetical protein
MAVPVRLDSIVTSPSWPAAQCGDEAPDLIWVRGSGAYAILSEGRITVVDMATIEERIGTLEMRVNNLETWAGPGQAVALAEGQRQIRADLAKMQAEFKAEFATLKAEFATLKTDVATLKTDVATLKTDMAEVKGTLREILRRLPAPPAEA